MMKKLALFLSFYSLVMHCQTVGYKVIDEGFKSVTIDTLFKDKISIRAIAIDKNKVWFGADNSRFGYYDLKDKEKYVEHIYRDTLKLEFRSVAQTAKDVFVLSIANPALLYQVSKKTKITKLVYKEVNDKVFYDSMQFWNDKEGIAVGDPTEDSFSILITRDGGNTWAKLLADQLPTMAKGEGAFAASNTNIVIKGKYTWLVSGGKRARVFYSSDKGRTWKVAETPIVQGKTMTGIFTADFYDSKNGFIAGGDYEIPEQNFDNKAITADGGKTWNLIAQNSGFGYASCVQYVPKSKGKGLVVIGALGLHYSADGGNTWKQLSTDSGLFTMRFINSNTAIAAGHNKMVQIHFKK